MWSVPFKIIATKSRLPKFNQNNKTSADLSSYMELVINNKEVYLCIMSWKSGELLTPSPPSMHLDMCGVHSEGALSEDWLASHSHMPCTQLTGINTEGGGTLEFLPEFIPPPPPPPKYLTQCVVNSSVILMILLIHEMIADIKDSSVSIILVILLVQFS